MNRLRVSIIISTGIRGVGVPSGSRCPRAIVGWFRRPMITVASQRGTARPMFSDSWVVGVKVYGRRPSMLRVMRNSINDIKIRAHLWPPKLIGMRSWFVNRLINQLWRVKSRLVIQRVVGVGNKSQGSRRARATKGIPRRTGLMNWSKKLSVMVSFRILFLVFLCFGWWAHLGMCGL